jgi:hypothetical protein
MHNVLKKIKAYLFELLFLIIISFVPLLWFQPGHSVLGLDSGYAVNHVQYFDQRIYTWLGSENFGIDMTAETGGVLYNLFPAIIQSSGVPLFDVQKVLFVFWFFAIAASMYALVTYLFPQKDRWVIRLLAVSIYVFNFHLYPFWLQGEQAILASYVLLPLVTLFLFRFVQKRTNTIRSAIYLSLTYIFFSADGIRGIPLIGPVLVTGIILLAYYFLFSFKKEGFTYLKRCGFLFLWFLMFSVFCNAFFLLPFISSIGLQYQSQVNAVGGIESAIQWTKAISVNDSFINLFLLQGDGNWYNKPFLWAYPFITNPFLVIISFLFPIFAYLAPLFSKENKEKIILVFFAILGLLGIFLSAGSHPPLGDLYLFLMAKIPGFAAYRSAYYKFMPLVYFSFAILIGTSVYYFLNKFSQKIKYIGGSVAILLILLYHYPFFIGSNFIFDKPFTTMVQLPQYVTKFAQMKNASSNDYRSLVVPQMGINYVKTYNWGYYAAYPIFPLITNKGFVENDPFYYQDSDNNVVDALYSSLKQNRINAFLSLAKSADIKYILVPTDISWNYFQSLAEDPKTYLSVLNKNKSTFALIWKNGPWYYYEIKGITPRKIQAYSSIVMKEGDPTYTDSILQQGILPFGTADQTKVPAITKGIYTDFTCETCDIIDNSQNLILSTSMVNPTSPLYPFKIKLEERNSGQDLGNNLGLSLKRVSELYLLNTIPLKSPDKWAYTADLLKNNWQIVNSQYENQKNSKDYNLLSEILQYKVFESSYIEYLITTQHLDKSSQLGRSLIAADKEISKYKGNLGKQLDKNYWANNFIYNISSAQGKIYLNPSSLPHDQSGNILLPQSYSLDGKTYPYTNPDTQNPSIDVDHKASTLMLTFSSPNLFSNPNTHTVTQNGEKENCLIQTIPSYSGSNEYLLSGSVDKSGKGDVYFTRYFDVVKTPVSELQGVGPTSNTTLLYSLPYSNIYSFTTVVSGMVNDKSAQVSFCTPDKNNPANALATMNITQIVKPELYSYTQTNVKGTTPNIIYHEINPTHYEIDVHNATNPYVLSFADRFSRLWELYQGKDKVDTHFILDGYANGWVIDKKGDYHFSLIFTSQKIFQISYITTFVSVSILLLYVVIRLITLIKNEKNKK